MAAWSEQYRYLWLVQKKIINDCFLIPLGTNLLAPGVNVAAVVVVGDVPAPVSGPGVEHHDVVLGPPDEEAAGLD